METWTPKKINALLESCPAVVPDDYTAPKTVPASASVAAMYRSQSARGRAAFLQCIMADRHLSADWHTLVRDIGPLAHPDTGWPALDRKLVIESFTVDIAPVSSVSCYMTGQLFIHLTEAPLLLTAGEFNLLSGHRIDQHIRPGLEARADALRRVCRVVNRPSPVMRRVSYTDGAAVGTMRIPLWLPDQASRYIEQRGLHPL